MGWWPAPSAATSALILVVSGLDSKQEREGEPRKLLEWGFKSFKPFRLFDQGQKVSDALVWGGTQHYVPLVGNGNINIILPVTSSGKVSASIVYHGPIKAPIRKGDQRGGAARHLGRIRRRPTKSRFMPATTSARAISPCADSIRCSCSRLAGCCSRVRCDATARSRPAGSSHSRAARGPASPRKPASSPIGWRAPGRTGVRHARAGRVAGGGGDPRGTAVRQDLAVRSIRRSVDVLDRARRPCRARASGRRCTQANGWCATASSIPRAPIKASTAGVPRGRDQRARAAHAAAGCCPISPSFSTFRPRRGLRARAERRSGNRARSLREPGAHAA